MGLTTKPKCPWLRASEKGACWQRATGLSLLSNSRPKWPLCLGKGSGFLPARQSLIASRVKGIQDGRTRWLKKKTILLVQRLVLSYALLSFILTCSSHRNKYIVNVVLHPQIGRWTFKKPPPDISHRLGLLSLAGQVVLLVLMSHSRSCHRVPCWGLSGSASCKLSPGISYPHPSAGCLAFWMTDH